MLSLCIWIALARAAVRASQPRVECEGKARVHVVSLRRELLVAEVASSC